MGWTMILALKKEQKMMGGKSQLASRVGGGIAKGGTRLEVGGGAPSHHAYIKKDSFPTLQRV